VYKDYEPGYPIWITLKPFQAWNPAHCNSILPPPLCKSHRNLRLFSAEPKF
jgi:hypothetical protein